MEYEQDWLMRQIKIMTNIIGKMIFKKTDNMEEIMETDLTRISRDIDKLLLNNDINNAENKLFLNIDINNYQYLKMGLDFYDRINRLDDKELADADFSREEIKQGLSDFIAIYGFDYLNVNLDEL